MNLGIGSLGPLGRLQIRGEPGHEIVAELAPLVNEPVIDKPGRSAFAYTDFELILRNKDIKNLIFAGITTDGAVSSSMRDAIDRGFDCMLIEDATSASEHNLHHYTCESVKMEGGILGATGKTDDILHALDNFRTGGQRQSGIKSQRETTPPPTSSNVGTPTSVLGQPLGAQLTAAAVGNGQMPMTSPSSAPLSNTRQMPLGAPGYLPAGSTMDGGHDQELDRALQQSAM